MSDKDSSQQEFTPIYVGQTKSIREFDLVYRTNTQNLPQNNRNIENFQSKSEDTIDQYLSPEKKTELTPMSKTIDNYKSNSKTEPLLQNEP